MGERTPSRAAPPGRVVPGCGLDRRGFPVGPRSGICTFATAPNLSESFSECSSEVSDMVEGFTRRPGYKLYRAMYGNCGPAVLLLHDGTGSSLSLNHRETATLVDWLWQRKCRVVTFDLRGHGQSSRVRQLRSALRAPPQA